MRQHLAMTQYITSKMVNKGWGRRGGGGGGRVNETKQSEWVGGEEINNLFLTLIQP